MNKHTVDVELGLDAFEDILIGYARYQPGVNLLAIPENCGRSVSDYVEKWGELTGGDMGAIEAYEYFSDLTDVVYVNAPSVATALFKAVEVQAERQKPASAEEWGRLHPDATVRVDGGRLRRASEWSYNSSVRCYEVQTGVDDNLAPVWTPLSELVAPCE
jgi:hypothetical protein